VRRIIGKGTFPKLDPKERFPHSARVSHEDPDLIEPLANDGFRATSGPPLAVSGEGATREEALARLREEIDRRLASGAAVVPLEIAASEETPPIWGIGMFRDNPLFDEWQAAIAEYRRKVDEEEDIGPP
jgi:hypothetical protein